VIRATKPLLLGLLC